MDPLWIEKGPASRHGTAVLAFALAGMAPAVVLAAAPIGVLAATSGIVFAVAAGAALAVRVERALVYADGDMVLVRGYLWTRRIDLGDVVGIEGSTLYWCGRHGRLRISRLAALSDPISRAPSGSSESAQSRRQQHRIHAWIEQAVGGGIKRRARLVGRLDDAALAHEGHVAAAGVRWETRRRWLGGVQPRPRWGVLRAASERETAARARTSLSPGPVGAARGSRRSL